MRQVYWTFGAILCFFLFSSHAEDNSNELSHQYIDQYRDLAVIEMHRSGIPASIILAQALVESRYGTSKLATDANNHFGIKCKSYWKGMTYYHKNETLNDTLKRKKVQTVLLPQSSGLQQNSNIIATSITINESDDVTASLTIKNMADGVTISNPKAASDAKIHFKDDSHIDIEAGTIKTSNHKAPIGTTAIITVNDQGIWELSSIDDVTASDGTETKIIAGPNVVIVGAGTTTNPYIVSASSSQPKPVDGIEISSLDSPYTLGADSYIKTTGTEPIQFLPNPDIAQADTIQYRIKQYSPLAVAELQIPIEYAKDSTANYKTSGVNRDVILEYDGSHNVWNITGSYEAYDYSPPGSYGPEELIDGDFENNNAASEWLVIGEGSGKSASFSNGELRYISDTTSPILYVRQNGTQIVGETYRLEYEIVASNGRPVKVESFPEGPNKLETAVGIHVMEAVADRDAFQIVRATTDVDVTFGYISLKRKLN